MSVKVTLMAVFCFIIVFRETDTKRKDQTEDEIAEQIARKIFDKAVKLAKLKKIKNFDSAEETKFLRRVRKTAHSEIDPLMERLSSISSDYESSISKILDALKRRTEEEAAKAGRDCGVQARSDIPPDFRVTSRYARLLADDVLFKPH